MSSSLLEEAVDTHSLFALLNQTLVQSNETACGVILASSPLGPVGLSRLRERVARSEPELAVHFADDPSSGTFAMLLPDLVLSDTHYAALSVKQLMLEEGIAVGQLVIASFPECGIPKESDLQAMHALMERESDGESSILIYNPPEVKRKPATILIVDEDETGGELLDTLLRRRGYEVFTAHNGLDGLRMFQTLSPDLVITELSLPVYDGYDLIRRIRQRQAKQPAQPECSIMVLSEKRVERDISACFELGVSDYIKKPYSPMEVEARIRRLLS